MRKAIVRPRRIVWRRVQRFDGAISFLIENTAQKIGKVRVRAPRFRTTGTQVLLGSVIAPVNIAVVPDATQWRTPNRIMIVPRGLKAKLAELIHWI